MRYFGTDETGGYQHLLAVYPDADDETSGPTALEFYVSTPFEWNENDNLVVGPPIPEGSRIRFAEGTREELLAGVESSASQATETFEGKPDAALVFSCAARHGFLGTRVKREFEILAEHLGGPIPTIGYYSYGEFCPLSQSLIPRAHASTFVSVLIGEHE